jgi:protein-tyrosine phosphatase
MREAIDLAAAAVRDGITTIAATPHVSHRYPTSAADMERAVLDVVAALQDNGIGLNVLPGGELTIERASRMSIDERLRFGLGGRPEYLLVEFPYHGWPMDLGVLVDTLRRQGITVVIAHPERSAEVRADPERVRPLVEGGALVQVTASSLDGQAGRETRTATMALIQEGLAHLIASDAHSPDVRRVGMSGAARAVGEPRLARWLTSDVPGSLVSGERIPPRPHSRVRRRSWWFS